MQEKKYCAAPWRGLHINQTGDVKFCCAGKPGILGNLNTASLEQCLQSPAAQQLRRQISQGHLPEYCTVCVERERFGGQGERHWHNSINADFDVKHASPLEHAPSLVDVRWNTTCNLRCNYCDSRSSSQWAAYHGIRVDSSVRSYSTQVHDYVSLHRQSIREVAMVGGEPLLLPDNIEFLRVIPPTSIVTLITNLNVDLESNRVFEKLKNRKRVGWSISFENIGKRFEFVRYGADWDLLEHNLDIVQDLWRRQQQWGGVHAVYSIYNATRLCEFREYLNSRNLTVVWQVLHTPKFLDPIQLGNGIRQKAIDEINLLLRTVRITDVERQHFQKIKQAYETAQDQDLRHQFPNHLDNRIQDFIRLWPELASLCESNQL